MSLYESDRIKRWQEIQKTLDIARAILAVHSESIAWQAVKLREMPTAKQASDWSSAYDAWHSALGAVEAELRAERAGFGLVESA